MSYEGQLKTRKPMNIAFIHPDLGIGGAERLVVDAALALQSVNGNKVTIYTSHCNKAHCFEEIAKGELEVKVYGDFLPTNFKGRFLIVFAFLRQLYLVLKLMYLGELNFLDLLVLDQLSYCIPILHYFKKNDTKILFYCHFPDKLLSPHSGFIRKSYRYVFDKVEEFSTGCADQIVVNSKFTKSIVMKTFRSLANEPLSVVYPCVSTSPESFRPSSDIMTEIEKKFSNASFFLSINRFERKKNIQLAIKSFAEYIHSTDDSSQKLIIAGGYDQRLLENVQYLKELMELCEIDLKLSTTLIHGGNITQGSSDARVWFMPSISTDLKNTLLSKCDMLLYTPSFEHFGIVPIEAMRLGKLVLADASGGPLESIVNFFQNKTEYTGFTVESDVQKWCDVLELVKGLTDEELMQAELRNKQRVDELFSFVAMRKQLVDVVKQMKPKVYTYELVLPSVFNGIIICFIVFLLKSFL